MTEPGGTATVWILNGDQSTFPSGVFTRRELAVEWIQNHRLSGVLTEYPVDEGVYEWAISRGLFKPKKENQTTSAFIARFSSASQDHYHFENGSSKQLPIE
jgi:hypothetical protein